MPSLLASYTISFLECKSRVRLSLTNHLLYNHSNQSIAKYHLIINQAFIQRKLIKKQGLNQYNNYKSVTLKETSCNYSNTKKSKLNFQTNIRNILHSSSVNSIVTSKCASYKNIVNSSSMSYLSTSYLDQKATLTNLKSLTVTDWRFNLVIDPLQHLWIHNYNNNSSDIINISNGDTSIQKYLVNNNKLEYLNLTNIHHNTGLNYIKCDGTRIPHPIFWLWNIAHLKSAEIGILLPRSESFQKECNKLLSSSIIVNKAKKQSDFTKLSLRIAGTKSYGYVSDDRSSSDNSEVSLTNDMNIFMEYLRKIYTNLESIEYTFAYGYWGVNTCCNLLNWNNIFYNIKHLKIDIRKTDVASSLLSYFISNSNLNKQLQVCHLSDIRPKLNKMIVNGVYKYFINDSINIFMDKVCNFIKNRPPLLHSFAIRFSEYYDSRKHLYLKTTYWNPYIKYLKCLLNMVENRNDIFDGYLNLKLGVVHMKTRRETEWFRNEHSWNKENIKCSLELSQLICKLQTKIHQYNQQNTNNQKKTILDLYQLNLTLRHHKFLKFWFHNDLNLFKNNNFVMY